jgi:hypothetical protein
MLGEESSDDITVKPNAALTDTTIGFPMANNTTDLGLIWSVSVLRIKDFIWLPEQPPEPVVISQIEFFSLQTIS